VFEFLAFVQPIGKAFSAHHFHNLEPAYEFNAGYIWQVAFIVQSFVRENKCTCKQTLSAKQFQYTTDIRPHIHCMPGLMA